MTADFADEASEHTERQLLDALKVRKFVPNKCEAVKDGVVCGKPVAILHNGVQCVFCKACLAVRWAGDLTTI